MIRLVSQFDRPRMHASVAAPKSSGSCSCCCCCVVTTVAASVLTLRAVGQVSPDQSEEELSTRRRWKVLALCLLPMSILLSIAAASSFGSGSAFGGVLAYVAGLFVVRHRAGLQKRYFAILLLGIPVACVVEAVVWISMWK